MGIADLLPQHRDRRPHGRRYRRRRAETLGLALRQLHRSPSQKSYSRAVVGTVMSIPNGDAVLPVTLFLHLAPGPGTVKGLRCS